MPPPATAPANQQAEPAVHPRRSPRLNPEPGRVCAIKGPPGNLPPQSKASSSMARTYPLFVSYGQCLGAKEEPFAFASLCLEDLRNGRSQYLVTIKQLIDTLPKTESPTSCFALRGHIAPPEQPQLRHSMWAAIRWLLPSDGEFRRSSHSLQYYLTRQGRRLVLRGGDVTQPLYESRINWVHDPTSPAPRRHYDLTSPALASAENTPPSEVHHKLPRCLRPRRRRSKQPVSSANENSASRVVDPATPLGPSANENSPRLPPSAVTRLRSTTNRNSPWNQPVI